MGLDIRTLRDQKESKMGKRIVEAKDLYLTLDRSQAVAEGPKASFLLAREGREVPVEYAALVTAKGQPKAKAKGSKEHTRGEDK